MQISGSNILIISPEPWDHIFVSKHHYAVHLAQKGANVVFANPPGSKWHMQSTKYSGVCVLQYTKFAPGIRFLPSAITSRIIKAKFRKIESYCRTEFDVIWSFDNSVFFDFTLLKSTFNISHIVDLNQDFETEKSARTADICFYTTHVIGNRMKLWNENAHFINHGYSENFKKREIELPGSNDIKLLYSGNLDMPYIDWETLYAASSRFSSVDFIFLGPNNHPNGIKSQVLGLSNVYTMGRIDASELQNFYKKADGLLICYQEAHHSDQANPHKMMEYLGSGKVVICTKTNEYQELDPSLILMGDKNIEFLANIERYIQEKEFYDQATICQERISFALSNGYNNQIAKIKYLIEQQTTQKKLYE